MSNRKLGRIEALSDAIARKGVLHLREAASLLGVSEMTVRRDVGANPARFAYLGGHIVHAEDIGGAYQLERAADSHAQAKMAACRHALQLVAPEDTLFIDCGSTLVHLAQQIPADLPLTVICYSLNVAQCLAAKPAVRLILLGGLYHPASATFASSDGLQPLERMGINKAFISAGGVDGKRGASCSHFHEVPVKQKAIAVASECHLVVDSAKFGVIKPAVFARLGDFRSIVTERGIASASA